MANTIDIILRMGGAAQVQRELQGVKGSFAAIGASLTSLNGFLAAAGVSAVVAGMRSMMKNAEDGRVSLFRLRAALLGAGDGAEQFAEALSAQADSLEMLTGFAADSVRQSQSMLLSMGATVEQVQKLSPLVLDVAAAMGTDATAAAKQLGSALDGQEISLGKLNIKARDFDDLLAQLNSRVRGQAAALMEARGPMQQMSIEFGRLSGAIGELLNKGGAPLFEFIAGTARAARQVLGMDNATPAAPPNQLRSLLPTSFPGVANTGPDEESSAIEAERARQASAAQALIQAEANLNNQYAFRKALIESDPLMGEVERREALAQVMRDELPTLQEREDLLRTEFDRQLRADPGRTLETTIEAERQLTQAQLERLRITQQIDAIGQAGTFGGELRSQVRALRDELGNLSVSMARVSFNMVTAGVQGLAGALTNIITGAQSAAQAFLAFGRAMLTQFISSILTAVLYAKVAIPILTALGVVSGGTTAATGAGVTTAALASGMAAAQAATSGGFAAGGYTGDGPVNAVAGPVHRGEFVVPAQRVRELGVANLEAMTFGGGGVGGGDPMRVVIVDDRRSAQQLMRDPRFRSFVVDLAQS